MKPANQKAEASLSAGQKRKDEKGTRHMVTEVAVFQAVPGKEDAFAQGILRGAEVIRRDAGCRSVTIQRCIEDPARFLLVIQWDSLEAHTEGFRKSPLFAEYRSHINGLFAEGSPIVHHYEVI